MKDTFDISNVNKVRQLREKARYDKATVNVLAQKPQPFEAVQSLEML